MEEFKGTKGTWIVSKIGAPDSNNEGCGCHTIGTDINQSYGFIDVWFSNIHQAKTMGEALANAQLIAAAPELLKTLQSVQKYILKKGITYDNADLWNEIDLAIKKSLGK